MFSLYSSFTDAFDHPGHPFINFHSTILIVVKRCNDKFAVFELLLMSGKL